MQCATIARLGLDAYVDAVCISGADGTRKPDPRIFALAAERSGTSLEGAWMIGDSEDDVAGARNAGVRSVWLRGGRTWARTDLRPDREAVSLLAALELMSGNAPGSRKG